MSDVYYGGEGGTTPRRTIVAVIELPDRSLMTPQERMMLLRSDVMDAMAQARKKLDLAAAKWRVAGYTWDLDTIAYDIPENVGRTITAALVIERPA